MTQTQYNTVLSKLKVKMASNPAALTNLLTQGDGYMRKKEYGKAAALFNMATVLDPNCKDAQAKRLEAIEKWLAEP